MKFAKHISNDLQCPMQLLSRFLAAPGANACVPHRRGRRPRRPVILITCVPYCRGRRPRRPAAQGAVPMRAWLVAKVKAPGYLLRCPIKSSGLRFPSILSTAATRSPRCICHRQRSVHSPPGIDPFRRGRVSRPAGDETSPLQILTICVPYCRGRRPRRPAAQGAVPTRTGMVNTCYTQLGAHCQRGLRAKKDHPKVVLFI